jgi:hypothetical protein
MLRLSRVKGGIAAFPFRFEGNTWYTCVESLLGFQTVAPPSEKGTITGIKVPTKRFRPEGILPNFQCSRLPVKNL